MLRQVLHIILAQLLLLLTITGCSHLEERSAVYTTKEHLVAIVAKPNKQDHSIYMRLANQMHKRGRLSTAKHMYLQVLSSTIPELEESTLYPTDLPGDTSTTRYGYGSYTINPKNSACFALAQICLEQENFKAALNYLKLSEQQHTRQINCGTGYNAHNYFLRQQYALCYEGMGKLDSAITMVLPEWAGLGRQPLMELLQRNFSPSELKEQLLQAATTIHCTPDTFVWPAQTLDLEGFNPTYLPATTYVDTSWRMQLFGQTVHLPSIYSDAPDTISMEHMKQGFLTSNFYTELTGDESFQKPFRYDSSVPMIYSSY